MRLRRAASMYHPRYSAKLAYMLQMVAYSPGEFWRWWRRTDDFMTVDRRRQLIKTQAAKLLLIVAYGIALAWLIFSFSLTSIGLLSRDWLIATVGIVGFVMLPYASTFGLLLIVWLGDYLVVQPKYKKQIANSKLIFASHQGTKIAVAGSYGKTTMKEILATVLQAGGKVAATPGNKNVAISHARFATRLDGDEDFVIVEFGEGYKGDVRRFTDTVQPQIGIVTGLAPNHLDQYGTLQNLQEDLFSLLDFVGPERAYLSGDAILLTGNHPAGHLFDQSGVDGWRIHDVSNSLEGLSFTLKNGNESMCLHSQLVGRHLIGPLALACVLAKTFGLSDEQIIEGIAHTRPFEHRLEPKQLHGAWLLDDTYNGSIEGMRAGLELLKELKAKGRKRYVTPGLVDQGEQTEQVHKELGILIADAAPDEVVLMRNSVTETITHSLQNAGYAGDVIAVDDPLQYYQNIEATLAAGDVVLLQNDWTDNYA